MYTGRTESNKIVNFEGDDSMIGKIVKMKIVSQAFSPNKYTNSDI